jgi:hypothetical protein
LENNPFCIIAYNSTSNIKAVTRMFTGCAVSPR